MTTSLKTAKDSSPEINAGVFVASELTGKKITTISSDQRRDIWRSLCELNHPTSIVEIQITVNSFLVQKGRKQLSELSEDEYLELLKQISPESGFQQALKSGVTESHSTKTVLAIAQQLAKSAQKDGASSQTKYSSAVSGSLPDTTNNPKAALVQKKSEVTVVLDEYSQTQKRIERQLISARQQLEGIGSENKSLESQKGFLGSRFLIPWRKSNNELLTEMQQANLSRKDHLNREIVRLEKAKAEHAEILLKLKTAVELIDESKESEDRFSPSLTAQFLHELEVLLNYSAAKKDVARLSIAPEGYMKKLAEISRDAGKLAESAEHAAIACRITRDVAIGTAATLATGGAAAALGTGVLAASGAVIVGTATGTTVAGISQIAEQSEEILLNNKSRDQAWNDGVAMTKKGAVISFVSSIAVVGGGAAVKGLTGIGGKLTGNLAPQIIAKFPVASKIIGNVLSGAVSGASYGAISGTMNQTQTVVAAYLVYRSSDRAKNLSVRENAAEFTKFLGEQGLTLSEAMKQILHNTLVGAVSGAIGSSGMAVRQATQSTLGKGLSVLAETGANTAVGIGSAAIDAKRHGRELTPNQIAEQIAFAIIGSAVAQATERLTTSKKLKNEGKEFFEKEADKIGEELIENLGEKGLKKTIYEETYNLCRKQGMNKTEAKEAATFAAAKVTKETVIEYVKEAGKKSAEATLHELETLAGTEGLTKEIYETTLQKGLDQGLTPEAAKVKAQKAGLEYAIKTVREVSRKNTEIVHDKLYEELRVSEQVEDLVTKRLNELDKQSWKETAKSLQQEGYSKTTAKAMAKQAHYALESGRNDRHLETILTDGITKHLENFTIKHGEKVFQQTFLQGIAPGTSLGQLFMKDANRVGKTYSEYSEIMLKAAIEGYRQGVHDSARKAVALGVMNAISKFRANKQKAHIAINVKQRERKKFKLVVHTEEIHEQEETPDLVPFSEAEEKAKAELRLMAEKIVKIQKNSTDFNGNKHEVTEIYKIRPDRDDLMSNPQISNLIYRNEEIILAEQKAASKICT